MARKRKIDEIDDVEGGELSSSSDIADEESSGGVDNEDIPTEREQKEEWILRIRAYLRLHPEKIPNLNTKASPLEKLEFYSVEELRRIYENLYFENDIDTIYFMEKHIIHFMATWLKYMSNSDQPVEEVEEDKKLLSDLRDATNGYLGRAPAAVRFLSRLFSYYSKSFLDTYMKSGVPFKSLFTTSENVEAANGTEDEQGVGTTTKASEITSSETNPKGNTSIY